jgi:hypothetical protein
MKPSGWIADALDFSSLLLTALVAGAMFAVWLNSNPAGMKFGDYVVMQQRNIHSFNTVLPLLGFLAALCTVATTVLSAGQSFRFELLLGAAACLIVAGLITKFCNQPINSTVLRWSLDLPPIDWTNLRDTWWRWHILRLVVGMVGLSLLILAALQRRG